MNEFELIARFSRHFDVEAPPAGPGDDCAVLDNPRGQQLITTDAVVEGVHFTRRTFSLEDVGHKALAVNLSDIAAMGGRPTWFVCALGLPADVSAHDVEALARGMAPLARCHGARLVGGNVTRSLQWTVTITVAGVAKRPVLRSRGRPGDELFVSGPLGDAAAGYVALSSGLEAEPGVASLVAAQRRPAPHLAFARAAAPFASAAIDVSDGLLQDLGHLAHASGVGADLSAAELPLSAALRAWASPAQARTFSLTGGEDYVLLVSVPKLERQAFERALERKRLSAFHVGRLSRRAGIRVDGKPSPRRAGFMHF